MVKLDYIRYFYYAAREKSILEASKFLGIPRSTLGKHIQAFETECGFNLFIRRKSGLDLTQKGEELFRFAAQSIESLEEGLMQIQQRKEPKSQVLKIITTTGMSHLWVISKLPAFRKIYPHIQVHIKTTNDQVDFLASGFDMAVFPKVSDVQDVIQRKIFTSHHFLFASPAYLKNHGTPKTIDELINHQLISFHMLRDKSHQGPIDWHIDLLGRDTLAPVISVNSAIGVLYAVKQGLGIGLLPSTLPFIKESKLVQLFDQTMGVDVDIFFIAKKEEHLQGDSPVAGFYKILTQK